MDLYCLRVRKEHAGRTFPFDRIYLTTNGAHTVFKDLFRYALIFPVESTLKTTLTDHVTLDTIESHPHDRNDDAPAPTHNDWRVMLETNDWVMAVPILSKFIKANMPRYITAAGKYRLPASVPTITRVRRRAMIIPAVDNPFPNLTYLQTPEQNIRPVCIACPNFINHQNGHCRLGEPLCFSSLALGLNNHFEEGLKEELPSENILLQED